MSQLLIQHYLNELADLQRVSGTRRESVVRDAFKGLLKGWGRTQSLVFVSEYAIETPAKRRVCVDGALLHELRVPFGYWEAKDEEDDLDREIEKKLRRGYRLISSSATSGRRSPISASRWSSSRRICRRCSRSCGR